MDATTPQIPRLRGWFHAVTAPIMLITGLLLTALAPGQPVRLALAAYTLTALLMFANSAVYHRGPWTPEIKQVFRRLDHSFIYVFIAGTYTPLCVALLHGRDRMTLLVFVWSAALLGLLFRICWLSAPRWLYTALYLVMGWAAMWWLKPMYQAGGAAPLVWLLLGGIVYTLGAVAYGMKRPNPSPAWFGFHEIFHLCTVIAAACHVVAIVLAAF